MIPEFVYNGLEALEVLRMVVTPLVNIMTAGTHSSIMAPKSPTSLAGEG